MWLPLMGLRITIDFTFPNQRLSTSSQLQIQWADACLIVYSLTDRQSFEYASRSLSELKQLQNHPTSYLIGNKADLDHLRVVSESEAAKLAASHSIGFCEVSVADNSPALYKAFEKLLYESRARPTKQRKFSVSKMIGGFPSWILFGWMVLVE